MDIKNTGLKTTKARKGLLEILYSQNKPIDAYKSSRILVNKGVKADQATIYRALNAFVKKGIVREVYFNDGVVRFELSNKPEHHHIICINCGKVEDIMDCSVERIEEQIKLKKGFKVHSHSLEFFGFCPKCSKNKIE